MATEPLDERDTRITDSSPRRKPAKQAASRGVRRGSGEQREGADSPGGSQAAEAASRAAGREETDLLRAVASRDEEACRRLIDRYHDGMVRLARGFVRTEELAEEVVQDTWMAALEGLSRFEGRSSFKTWLFGILIRQAREMGARERRTEAFSQLTPSSTEAECDPMEAFFHSERHPEGGSWAVPPQRWRHNPEDAALEAEVCRVVGRAVGELPEAQRLVVGLRDGEGWDTREVALLLGRSPNWVRVNLHRARVKIRLAVAARLGA